MFDHAVSITLEYPTEVYDFVDRLYTKALDRSADASGKECWAKSLIKGKVTGCQIATHFFLSQEMTKKNLSVDEYLNRLYRTCMNREADARGKNFWKTELSKGVSRKYVLVGFISSKE